MIKRLLFLALVAFAAWYGWHHYRDLLHHEVMSRAIIVNNTGHELTRVRLSAGDQSLGVKAVSYTHLTLPTNREV